MLIGGRFSFDRNLTPILVDTCLRHTFSGQSAQALNIPWILERLMDELSTAKAGALMVDHSLLICSLFKRFAHMASGEQLPVGWPLPCQH
jgi:hypothetical protein